MEHLIELDDDAVTTLGEGLRDARRDLNELFLEIFSSARAISAKRMRGTNSIVISRADWAQAKWRTVHEWSLHPPRPWWKIMGRWVQALMTFPVGYGFSDAPKLWGWIVVGTLVWAFALLATERWEW